MKGGEREIIGGGGAGLYLYKYKMIGGGLIDSLFFFVIIRNLIKAEKKL